MKRIRISNSITKRQSQSFTTYLRDIANIPAFTSAEEEHDCAVRAFNGDEGAKEVLIKRNLRFVVSVAKQYVINGVSLEDLVNQGNIGVSSAANKFDPTKGFKFISYAVWYIRKEIQIHLNNNSRHIRLPFNRINEITNYNVDVQRLEMKLMRPAEISDMLDEYDDYTRDRLIKLKSLSSQSVASLDKQIGDESGVLSDLISNNDYNADYIVNLSDNKLNIKRLFSVLNDTERDILNLLYGLDGSAPSTLTDVGNKYKLTREAIRQKREKAFRKMKVKCKSNIVDILG